ncbi:MAG: hypothetical protein ACRDY4_14510 [Acidimicrobiia bacterium]
MRRSALLLVTVTIASLALATPAGAGGDDPCDRLSKKQVRTIMGARPFGAPLPEDDGCSWETDPVDRDNYRYVLLEVKSLDDATEGYPDYRTARDAAGSSEAIEPIDGLGDEAYTGKTVLVPEGAIDSLYAVTGDTVVELSWQSRKPVRIDSKHYDKIVKIMRGLLEEA